MSAHGAPEQSASEAAPPVLPGPPPLLQRIKASPVTFALALINVAVFAWVESQGSSLDGGTLLRFGAVERTHVLAGEVWRVLTPMFLHIGLTHLAWNTYASFGFCTVVESVLGRARFLAIYLVSGIAGAAASALVWSKIGAGASGAMFGVVGATFAIRYRILGRACAMVSDRYVRSMLGQIAMWTVIGVFLLSVDHAAHFGGLLFGALGGLAATSRRRVLPWAVLAAALGALVAAAARPRMVPDKETATTAAFFAAEWATGTKEGFVKNAPRAVRLAELACRKPDVAACTQLARAMAEDADPVLSQGGKSLLEEACRAGVADACRPAEAAPAP